MSQLPEEVQGLIGLRCYETVAGVEVTRAAIRTMCAAVENSNPVYWQPRAARDMVDGEWAPATMLSAWGRPERWQPRAESQAKPLQLHYDLKALFRFPTAIVSSFESVFHLPVAVGDSLDTCQVLQSVSDEKETRLGVGRFWVIEMEYRNQRGDLAGVDTFNCFGYRKGEP